MDIPVIDFGAYSLDEEEVPEEPMHDLRQQFKTALTEVGFVFLKNTGITQEEMDRVLDVSLKFFQQPDELKRPFSWKNFDCPSHGWVFPEEERLSPLRPPDLKEAFNVCFLQPDIKWPQGEFREVLTSFFLRSKELSLRVLTVMAHSLGLDPEVFLSAHRSVGIKNNVTVLRTLYYPPVGQEVKEGQMRCGEHSDYGTISLLFHNNEGLQVRARSGEYIDVPVSPGYILINIADLMQRWTNDQFTSALHRVLLPPAGDSNTRQSVVFFLNPDDEALITCLDGSNKYPPVTGRAYLMKRIQAALDLKLQSFSSKLTDD